MIASKKMIIALIFIVFITGWLVVKYHNRSAATSSEPIWVNASKVKQVSLPLEVQALGSVVARSVEIMPEVSGHVKEIFFQDGTYVKAGTVLIQLDDAIAKAQYESAKAKLAYSKSDYERKAILGKQGAIAKQAIDAALADYKEKKAEADQSEVMLNKMKLLAPFDGMIGQGKINLGDYVSIGQSLVTLTDTKHLRVEYTVAEKFLPLLKLKQQVKLTASAYPGKTFYGIVSFISPIINKDNRSISLYASVANDNNLLAAGMFVNVMQALGTEESALMIPARSLVPILDGEEVYKIVDGKAYAVTVLIGTRTEKNVQITQGLSANDTVITDGQLKVKNNQSVKVKS